MVRIRNVRAGDLAHLAKAYASAYNRARVGEHWDTDHALKLLTHFHNLQPDLFFTADIRNVPIAAIVGVVKPWWDGNRVTDGELFVNPAYQKQGIATELLEHFITHAQARYAIVSIDWLTFRNRKFPLVWYTRLGFKQVKEWTIISGKPNVILESIIT